MGLYLGNISYGISTTELTCLPQPEAALFRFESSGVQR